MSLIRHPPQPPSARRARHQPLAGPGDRERDRAAGAPGRLRHARPPAGRLGRRGRPRRRARRRVRRGAARARSPRWPTRPWSSGSRAGWRTRTSRSTEESAARLAEAWAIGEGALARSRATSSSRCALWPEHFDIATVEGAGDARANYGVSPGDDDHDEPYAYVGPWKAPAGGDPFWNATRVRRRRGAGGERRAGARLLPGGAGEAAACAERGFRGRSRRVTTTAPRPARRLRLGAIVAALALPAVVVVVLVLLLTGGDDDEPRVSVFPSAKTLAASRDTTITLRGEDVDVEGARVTGVQRASYPGRVGGAARRRRLDVHAVAAVRRGRSRDGRDRRREERVRRRRDPTRGSRSRPSTRASPRPTRASSTSRRVPTSARPRSR